MDNLKHKAKMLPGLAVIVIGLVTSGRLAATPELQVLWIFFFTVGGLAITFLMYRKNI